MAVMTFISYAQNFEDLLLWRSLKGVEGGFYIDVGACDPTKDSVTRAFYDRGWRGINIEPDRRMSARLKSERPRDINLELAVGSKRGTIDFYETNAVGLSTTVRALAANHDNTKKPKSYAVSLSPLSDICEQFVTGPIHFLKIDVEGGERHVLEGANFAKWRPWIVVVEATLPMSTLQSHQEWEGLITDAGYAFAYFDGLNRYYIAKEHSDLAGSFLLPPNVFDDFLLHRMTTEGIKLAQRGALSANPDPYETMLWDYARMIAPHGLNVFRTADARIDAADKRVRDTQVSAEARAVAAETRSNDAERRRSRILVDLSTSFAWRGKNAVGIVRTEREIAARLLKDDSLDVIPVIFSGGNLRAIDPEQAIKLISFVAPSETRRAFVEPSEATGATVSARIVRSAKQAVRRIARLGGRLVPGRARDDVRMSLIHAYHALSKVVFGVPAAPVVPPPPVAPPPPVVFQTEFHSIVHPGPNDILFLGGLGWDVLDCRRIGILRAQSGMKIVSIIYDLIPTKMPQFLGGQPKDYFKNYFLHMVDLCDHIFCISETTENDLKEFCAHEQRKCPSTSVIYLGANLPAAPSDNEFRDAEVKARLKRRRFALSIGTFKIRKNYGFLLSLWEKLASDESFDLDLVIGGMPGWGTEDLMKRFEGSPLFGKRIFWFKGLSDEGVSWLYENCHVFVFPSLYEGWGLPVIEALQHRKPVIISNRGAVPEAGLGAAKIIDPDKPEEWMAEIKRHSKRPHPEEIPAVVIPTWEGASSSVKSTLVAIS